VRQGALNKIHELARKNSKVIFVGSDLGEGTLKDLKNELPDQYFMEGISEQYMIGFSAGLAKEGFLPYLNTIGTFLTRRAYEQIAIDVALHNLPVRILGSGGGMVYAPLGPTHTAIEDLSLMLNIPGLKVFAPADALEMDTILEQSLTDSSPYYIRLGKGGEPIITDKADFSSIGWKLFGEPSEDLLLIVTGILLHQAIQAQSLLSEIPVKVRVLHINEVSGMKVINLNGIISSHSSILVAEEHAARGGIYTELLHILAAREIQPKKLRHLSLGNGYSRQYGSQSDHLHLNQLDYSSIVSTIKDMTEESKIK